MNISEIRKEIDAIDEEIRTLLMKRLDCSEQVAQTKMQSAVSEGKQSDITIFRADREEEILKRLGAEVPEERRAGYLAVVRKIMETSRMYQYGIIFNNIENLFSPLAENLSIKPSNTRVRVSLTRENRPNAMSSILSMIGDYGFNMDRMELISQDSEQVTFELLIIGNLDDEKMQKLMFQLSKESKNFSIIYSY